MGCTGDTIFSRRRIVVFILLVCHLLLVDLLQASNELPRSTLEVVHAFYLLENL
jgi:hypothetical protein